MSKNPVEKPQIVVIQSQMEKYPEMIASQPTIGTESAEKLGSGGNAAKGAPPSAKFVDVALTGTQALTVSDQRRDDTRLLRLSEKEGGKTSRENTDA